MGINLAIFFRSNCDLNVEVSFFTVMFYVNEFMFTKLPNG